jgi:anthranilate phosphoribosyltransferase
LGDANEASFGALFAALQTKGPTVPEITALTEVILEYDRVEIPYKHSDDLCGIVGTGKDDLKTFNVSTASAIVAAGAGVKVVKNGSRSESSIAGATDVLEKVGVNIQARPDVILQTLKIAKITFCDAEPFFPRMGREYVGKFIFPHPLSYTLSIASGLSFKKMIFGSAFSETDFIANILKDLDITRFMVVAGYGPHRQTIDEISTIGSTKISEYVDGEIKTYTIEPEDLGISRATYNDIKQGNSVNENAEILMSVLTNTSSEAQRNIVIMNAGALIYIAGLASTHMEGIQFAKKSIESGSAKNTLDILINESNR